MKCSAKDYLTTAICAVRKVDGVWPIFCQCSELTFQDLLDDAKLICYVDFHSDTEGYAIPFVKIENVRVYPCGRIPLYSVDLLFFSINPL